MKLLRSTACKVIAFTLCYLAALAVLSSMSSTVLRYVAPYVPVPLFSLPPLSWTGLVVFFCLFCLSVGTSAASRHRFLRSINEVDFLLFVALSLCVIFLCANILYTNLKDFAYLLYESNLELSYLSGGETVVDNYAPALAAGNNSLGFYRLMIVLLLTFIAYGVFMALVATTIARIRDKRLKETIYWGAFFKAHPLPAPLSLAVCFLLFGNLVILFLAVSAGFKSYLNIPLFVFACITLALPTYFCRFVLRLGSSYQEANEERLKAERLKAELITNVSHDIRTPLTTIINYVDLIKQLPPGAPELPEYIDVLERKSQRLKTLIDDLMEASKAGARSIPVSLETIELAELIGQVAGEFDSDFSESQLSLVFEPAQEKAEVVADGNLLWRVVENLFSNAAKYSLPHTRVYADIRQADDVVLFSLKNVSRDQLNITHEELTERFVRGDRSRSSEGNGLGLYIAQNLMELMGGQMTITITGDLFEVVLGFGGQSLR